MSNEVNCTRRAVGPAVFFSCWAIAVVCLLVPAIGTAQLSYSITEINPDQSTLDPADADGASGGRVNNLAVSRDGRSVYAATEWGGIYKSTDGGLRWSRLNNHLPVATWDVEVDVSNSAKIYATSFYDGRTTSVAGINVSSDGGNSWIHPATVLPPVGFCDGVDRRNEPSAFGIAVDPDNPQNVYVGTNCGLAITNDAGLTWHFVDPTPTDPADDIWDVVVHDGGIIDLLGDDGHRRSTDGGLNWTTAATNPLPGGRGKLAVSPDESYVLFAVVGTTIYESDDGGQSWPTVITNPSPQGRIPFVATNQRGGASFDLWFGDIGLYRATCTTPNPPAPGGAARCPVNTWTNSFTRTSGAHDDAADIVFDPTVASDACPLLFASDGGVYVNTATTSPACQSPTWEQPTVTPHSLWLFGMAGVNQAGSNAEDLYFGNQDNGTYAAMDAAATPPTWTNRDCCDGFDVAAEATRVLYSVCCFLGGRGNRLYLRNRGMTGGAEINTYPPGNVPGWNISSNIENFGTDSYAVITTNGVFITTNIAANPIVWTQLGAATSPATPRGIRASSASAGQTFYVLSGVGDGRTADQLWRYDGTAAGNAWQRINPPGGTGGFGIFDVDPTDPNRLIVSYLRPRFDPVMLTSTDGGATWNPLSQLDVLMTSGGHFRYQNRRGPTNFTGFGGYPQPTLVAFDPSDRRIIVAGAADAGIFVSIDGGTTWTVLTDPINAQCLSPGKPHIPRPRRAHFEHQTVRFFTESVNIYIGSQGRGVWRIGLRIPRNLVLQCERFPGICASVELERGRIILDCRDRSGCILIDRVEKNCLIKYDCPGCGSTRLCPPFYQIFLDTFDPEQWSVSLFTGKGDPVEHELVRTKGGVVLSFRPSKELFVNGKIGDYLLAFAPNPDIKPQRVVVKTHLEVSDQPYGKGGG